MLSERQNIILKEIIEMYIEEQKPVGSINLSKKLNLSSSTIRNELLVLDKENLLINKNSLGREPSETGFRYYYENFATEKERQNVTYFKFTYNELKLAKIDLISLQSINEQKSILLIVFDNEIHLTQLFNTSRFTNIEIANINEILKKSLHRKRITEVSLEDLKNRYSKKSFFEILNSIINYISSLDNYKLDTIVNELEEISIQQDEIQNINILPNGLFIGSQEHNIKSLSKYTILKDNNLVYIFKIGVDYNVLKKMQSKDNETNNQTE